MHVQEEPGCRLRFWPRANLEWSVLSAPAVESLQCSDCSSLAPLEGCISQATVLTSPENGASTATDGKLGIWSRLSPYPLSGT